MGADLVQIPTRMHRTVVRCSSRRPLVCGFERPVCWRPERPRSPVNETLVSSERMRCGETSGGECMRFDASAVGMVRFCVVSAMPVRQYCLCSAIKCTMLIGLMQPVLCIPIVCLEFVCCLLLRGLQDRRLRGKYDGFHDSIRSIGR